MSLSLDGRLPSGQRTKLLRHIAECEPCAAAWDAMKQSQDLALSVERFDVSRGFREGLEQRIRSGEGAPDAVYRDPVPFSTKVRYVASGAAAAAVMIAAFNFLMPAGDPVRDTASPRVRDVAQVDRETVPLQPRSVESMPVKVNEWSLAQNVASQCASAEQRLRARLASLEGRPLQESWNEVRPILNDYKTAVFAMRWLQQKDMVSLPSDIGREFSDADDALTVIFGEVSWDRRQREIQRLQHARLGRVRERFQATCCRPMEALVSELGVLAQQNPEATRLFGIVGLDENTMREGQLRPGAIRLEVMVRPDGVTHEEETRVFQRTPQQPR